jgi:hypothetical protein
MSFHERRRVIAVLPEAFAESAQQKIAGAQ